MYDAREITKLFVFGTNTPSSDDYNSHIRPAAATPAEKHFNMLDYLTSGGGRFALPSLFKSVDTFFSAATIADGTYSLSALQSLLGFTGGLSASVSQYGTGIGSADHAERSYIFGNTTFSLASDMVFSVVGGVRSIQNLTVTANADNFDFTSIPDSFSQYINDYLLEPTLDPYELGRGEVAIKFDGPGKTYTNYSSSDYAAHQAAEADINGSVADGIVSLVKNGGASFFSNITSDKFLAFKTEGLKVVYGTSAADELDSSDAELSFDVYFGYRFAGGEGNDTIDGNDFADRLEGGDGNDELSGWLGADTLVGGKGNDQLWGGVLGDTLIGGEGDDTLDGGLVGQDVAIYDGKAIDYDILRNADDTYTIRHVRGDMTDGTDTLEDIEQVKFSDQTFQLAVNSIRTQRDFALVVDTTGSMSPYIDAVKGQMNNLVNKLLGDGTIDGRISIVGFKDPGETETILSFTSQDDLAARKAAAQAAINGVGVSGGGDYPEGANSGLLHSLKGNAGKFRDTAVARDIAIFTDAEVKDTWLADEVAMYADDIGVTISGMASARTAGVAVTEFSFSAAADGKVPAPVRIFSILVGPNGWYGSTKTDVEGLAQNGGTFFDTDTLDQLTEALFKIIETPANSAPEITSNGGGDTASLSLTEGIKAVASVAATDVDGDTVSYAIIGGADSTLFTIDSNTGALSFNTAPVFAAPADSDGDNVYDVIVGASDGLTSDTQSLFVTVTESDVTTPPASIGTKNADNLIGTTGNDEIRAKAGNDTVNGGTGDDFITGDAGNDRITAGKGDDSVDGGDGDDVIYGRDGDDLLTGGAGSDRIIGDAGNDRIYGQAGDDELSGGAGMDIFVFGADGGNDTVTDFTIGEDRLNLTQTGLSFSDLLIVSDLDGTTVQFGTTMVFLKSVGSVSASDFIF